MKRHWNTGIITFAIAFSGSVFSQTECGNEVNCYYQKQAVKEKVEEQREEAFREKRLQLEQAQLRELRNHNMLLQQQQERSKSSQIIPQNKAKAQEPVPAEQRRAQPAEKRTLEQTQPPSQ